MTGSQPEAHPPLIPIWLSNAAAIGWRVLVVFALIVVLADLAVILGTVVASILFALIVAVLFAPVATRLRDRGWSRTKTAGGVTLLAILVIGLIVILLAIAVVPLVPGIVDAIQSGLTRLQADAQASGQGGQLGVTIGQARSNAEAWIGEPARERRVLAGDRRHRDDPREHPDLLPPPGRRQSLGLGAPGDRRSSA